MWNGITYPFPNFNRCVIEVWELIHDFKPRFIMVLITYPCWDSSQSLLENGVQVRLTSLMLKSPYVESMLFILRRRPGYHGGCWCPGSCVTLPPTATALAMEGKRALVFHEEGFQPSVPFLSEWVPWNLNTYLYFPDKYSFVVGKEITVWILKYMKLLATTWQNWSGEARNGWNSLARRQDKHTDRHRHTQTQIKTQTQTYTDTNTDRNRHTQTHTNTDTDTSTDTDTGIHTDTDTDTQRQRHRHTNRYRHIQRQRHRHTNRCRQTDTHTDIYIYVYI